MAAPFTHKLHQKTVIENAFLIEIKFLKKQWNEKIVHTLKNKRENASRLMN